MFGEAGFILKDRKTSVFMKVTCQRFSENENKSRGLSPEGVSFHLLLSNADKKTRVPELSAAESAASTKD